MADPWLAPKLKVITDLMAAEGTLFKRILDLLGKWATKIRTAVFGAGGMPDVHAVPSLNPWFAAQVDDELIVEIEGIFDQSAENVNDNWEPDANARVRDYLTASRNRLVRVPDSVYAQINRATLKATTEGWSIDDLAARVEDILGESGQDAWAGRARTIARTEAIGAYNAGRFAGFQSLAGQLGGSWEKVWLATHDHRTRFTHARRTGADEQRVPLNAPFDVGGALLMYPGDPAGPPQEVINCRCSILLAREGEPVDLSNRHFRGLT